MPVRAALPVEIWPEYPNCAKVSARPLGLIGDPVPRPYYHRLQLFTHLVWHRDRSGKRMSPKLAWRVAGIASGQVEAIPDSVLAWWWKLQDLRPGAEGAQATEETKPTSQSDGT
jgi:hypothetical protein